jgi:hypothetical protein
MVRNMTDADLVTWIAKARAGCDHTPVVQRPDRRADHETQAGQTANVWAGQDRFASSSADWRSGLKSDCTKIAPWAEDEKTLMIGPEPIGNFHVEERV